MPKIYTIEDLRAMTPQHRLDLYNNAKKRPEGNYIVLMIEENGFPLSSGGLSLDDPVYLKIVEIVWSKEGQAALVKAVENGIPALCGVDPLLQEALGERYGKHDLGTASAGSVVAEVMRHRGYKEAGQGTCPKGCTAKTGMRWR